MFTKFKSTPKTPTRLETVLDLHLYAMQTITDRNSPEYAKLVDQLVKIQPLTPPTKERKPLDPNALAAVLANILGIGMIVGHERLNVVTSKALSFIGKAST